MKLSNYRRNFLHRRVVLTFLYCERLWTEFIASSHNAKSRYILRNIHGFLKLHLLSVKSTNLTRLEISKTLFSNIFFLDYLTTIFITNINHLHEIGKDLKWRTTYLESVSLPVKRLYEARGRRFRAYSWTSLPCLFGLTFLFSFLLLLFLFLFFFSSSSSSSSLILSFSSSPRFCLPPNETNFWSLIPCFVKAMFGQVKNPFFLF